MPIIGLTGGVATGKSTFSALLLRELPMEHFDSDRCVHELLAGNGRIRDAIRAAFGPEICDEKGWPSRARLRELVFASDADRKTLENILHPFVRESWMAITREAKAAGAWLLVDVPLLYETSADGQFDRVVVVGCPRETQIRRITSKRGLAPVLASRIIDAQLDLGEKTKKADHVIWNDSTVPNLDGQSRLLAAWLRRRFN